MHWTQFIKATKTPPSIKELKRKYGLKKTDAQRIINDMGEYEYYLNNRYEVGVRDLAWCYHLTIKRIDRKVIHDWRDLQRIKNEIIGKENEGFELYPAQSRVVDTANQYHLWVVKDTDFRFGVGFFPDEEITLTEQQAQAVGAKQRPFEQE